MQKIKGAPAEVLRAIKAIIDGGQHEITYLTLCMETGYSAPAVQAAITRLEQGAYIRVERRGPARANRYSLITDEQRNAVQVARLVGLVQ